jgi:methyl-accepting chemotaxis protein
MEEFRRKIDDKDLRSAKMLLDRWLTEFHPLRDKIDELIDLQQKEGERLKTDYEAAAMSSIALGFVILAIAVSAGAVIMLVFSRKIKREIGGEPAEVMAIAGRIADGDLTVKVNIQAGDTSSAMAAMRRMAENLERMITDIIVASQNLAQAVEQISSGNQNMSQRTSEQASSLEEIAATVEEATAAINQNCENATRASGLAEDSTRLAEEGGLLVTAAVTSINAINSAGVKIGNIVSAINEIAFQTNLLALNAAVEAARAGEQGRGFAVVAGEVRNLAQRAGNAAKEIGELIKDSLAKIDEGTGKVNRSGEALREIIASVNNVRQMVSEITASSNEQKQGISQINAAINDLDGVTQQNAALVEETASASEEMANQAKELLGMTERFRIRETAMMSARESNHKDVRIHASDGGNGRSDADGNGRRKPAAVSAGHAIERIDTGNLKPVQAREGFE